MDVAERRVRGTGGAAPVRAPAPARAGAHAALGVRCACGSDGGDGDGNGAWRKAGMRGRSARGSTCPCLCVLCPFIDASAVEEAECTSMKRMGVRVRVGRE